MSKEQIIAFEDGVAKILEGDELESFLADRQKALDYAKKQKDEEIFKETKKAALLAKLGITADEAALLLL